MPVVVGAAAAVGAGFTTWSIVSSLRVPTVHLSLSEPSVVMVEPECESDTPTDEAKAEPAEPDPDPSPEPESRPPFGPGSCLPPTRGPDRRIGLPYSETAPSVDHQLDHFQFVGVSASPTRHGVLAAWTREAIFYTDSDGARFRRVLDGPGVVYGAVVDCRGGVYALRGSPHGTMLGYSDGRVDSWRVMAMRNPDLTTDEGGTISYEDSYFRVSLFAGGGWVGVAAEEMWFTGEPGSVAMAMVSPDAGASWRFVSVPEVHGGNEGIVPVAMTGRRMRALGFEGDCMYSGTMLFEFDLVTGQQRSATAVSHDNHIEPAVRGRWAYSTRNCDAAICVLDLHNPERDGDGDWSLDWRPVRGTAIPAGVDRNEFRIEVISGTRAGTRVVGRVGPRLLHIRGKRARELADDIPDELRFLAVDSSDRPIGLSDNGRIVRWSARHGLRTLYGARETD